MPNFHFSRWCSRKATSSAAATCTISIFISPYPVLYGIVGLSNSLPFRFPRPILLLCALRWSSCGVNRLVASWVGWWPVDNHCAFARALPRDNDNDDDDDHAFIDHPTVLPDRWQRLRTGGLDGKKNQLVNDVNEKEKEGGLEGAYAHIHASNAVTVDIVRRDDNLLCVALGQTTPACGLVSSSSSSSLLFLSPCACPSPGVSGVSGILMPLLGGLQRGVHPPRGPHWPASRLVRAELSSHSTTFHGGACSVARRHHSHRTTIHGPNDQYHANSKHDTPPRPSTIQRPFSSSSFCEAPSTTTTTTTTTTTKTPPSTLFSRNETTTVRLNPFSERVRQALQASDSTEPCSRLRQRPDTISLVASSLSSSSTHTHAFSGRVSPPVLHSLLSAPLDLTPSRGFPASPGSWAVTSVPPSPSSPPPQSLLHPLLSVELLKRLGRPVRWCRSGVTTTTTSSSRAGEGGDETHTDQAQTKADASETKPPKEGFGSCAHEGDALVAGDTADPDADTLDSAAVRVLQHVMLPLMTSPSPLGTRRPRLMGEVEWNWTTVRRAVAPPRKDQKAVPVPSSAEGQKKEVEEKPDIEEEGEGGGEEQAPVSSLLRLQWKRPPHAKVAPYLPVIFEWLWALDRHDRLATSASFGSHSSSLAPRRQRLHPSLTRPHWILEYRHYLHQIHDDQKILTATSTVADQGDDGREGQRQEKVAVGLTATTKAALPPAALLREVIPIVLREEILPAMDEWRRRGFASGSAQAANDPIKRAVSSSRVEQHPQGWMGQRQHHHWGAALQAEVDRLLWLWHKAEEAEKQPQTPPLQVLGDVLFWGECPVGNVEANSNANDDDDSGVSLLLSLAVEPLVCHRAIRRALRANGLVTEEAGLPVTITNEERWGHFLQRLTAAAAAEAEAEQAAMRTTTDVPAGRESAHEDDVLYLFPVFTFADPQGPLLLHSSSTSTSSLPSPYQRRDQQDTASASVLEAVGIEKWKREEKEDRLLRCVMPLHRFLQKVVTRVAAPAVASTVAVGRETTIIGKEINAKEPQLAAEELPSGVKKPATRVMLLPNGAEGGNDRSCIESSHLSLLPTLRLSTLGVTSLLSVLIRPFQRRQRESLKVPRYSHHHEDHHSHYHGTNRRSSISTSDALIYPPEAFPLLPHSPRVHALKHMADVLYESLGHDQQSTHGHLHPHKQATAVTSHSSSGLVSTSLRPTGSFSSAASAAAAASTARLVLQRYWASNTDDEGQPAPASEAATGPSTSSPTSSTSHSIKERRQVVWRLRGVCRSLVRSLMEEKRVSVQQDMWLAAQDGTGTGSAGGTVGATGFRGVLQAGRGHSSSTGEKNSPSHNANDSETLAEERALVALRNSAFRLVEPALGRYYEWIDTFEQRWVMRWRWGPSETAGNTETAKMRRTVRKEETGTETGDGLDYLHHHHHHHPRAPPHNNAMELLLRPPPWLWAMSLDLNESAVQHSHPSSTAAVADVSSPPSSSPLFLVGRDVSGAPHCSSSSSSSWSWWHYRKDAAMALRVSAEALREVRQTLRQLIGGGGAEEDEEKTAQRHSRQMEKDGTRETTTITRPTITDASCGLAALQRDVEHFLQAPLVDPLTKVMEGIRLAGFLGGGGGGDLALWAEDTTPPPSLSLLQHVANAALCTLRRTASASSSLMEARAGKRMEDNAETDGHATLFTASARVRECLKCVLIALLLCRATVLHALQQRTVTTTTTMTPTITNGAHPRQLAAQTVASFLVQQGFFLSLLEALPEASSTLSSSDRAALLCSPMAEWHGLGVMGLLEGLQQQQERQRRAEEEERPLQQRGADGEEQIRTKTSSDTSASRKRNRKGGAGAGRFQVWFPPMDGRSPSPLSAFTSAAAPSASSASFYYRDKGDEERDLRASAGDYHDHQQLDKAEKTNAFSGVAPDMRIACDQRLSSSSASSSSGSSSFSKVTSWGVSHLEDFVDSFMEVFDRAERSTLTANGLANTATGRAEPETYTCYWLGSPASIRVAVDWCRELYSPTTTTSSWMALSSSYAAGLHDHDHDHDHDLHHPPSVTPLVFALPWSTLAERLSPLRLYDEGALAEQRQDSIDVALQQLFAYTIPHPREGMTSSSLPSCSSAATNADAAAAVDPSRHLNSEKSAQLYERFHLPPVYIRLVSLKEELLHVIPAGPWCPVRPPTRLSTRADSERVGFYSVGDCHGHGDSGGRRPSLSFSPPRVTCYYTLTLSPMLRLVSLTPPTGREKIEELFSE